MQLSAYPELRSARNDLARRIQKKPGDKYYLAAIAEANRVVQRAFRETNGNVRRAVREVGKVTRSGKPQKSQRPLSEAVTQRASTEAVKAARGGKKRRQRPATGVSEADLARVVSAAVGRAIGEALAPQVRQSASAAPAKRPVHELDENELAAAFETVIAGQMVAPFWAAGKETTTAAQASSAAVPPADDKPLHTLDHETADAVMAAGTDSYAEAYGLTAPFWRGQ